MSVNPIDELLLAIEQAFQQQQLVKLVLSKYVGQEPNLQRIDIKMVNLRQVLQLSFLYHYQTQDMTKNYSWLEAKPILATLLAGQFKQINLLTSQQETQLLVSKKGKLSVSTKKITQAQALNVEHNRQKQRYLSLNKNYWPYLGITDQAQQLIPAMSRKWSQINKFIEIFDNAISEAKLDLTQPLSVVDFGSGKGYLTFAIHDYLRQAYQNQATVTGVELRDNLVSLCNTAVAACQLSGLQFYQGDVRSYQPQKLDVMIALHACDIATDYAIHTGIRLQAKVIMCAPCCHKQLRPQMLMPTVLKPMLQHGVHLGQEAEMITDALRALLLEAEGYQTQVFEFIALEHTSKNKMILAVKKTITEQKRAALLKQITELKKFYGIKEQCLESLLCG